MLESESLSAATPTSLRSFSTSAAAIELIVIELTGCGVTTEDEQKVSSEVFHSSFYIR